MRLRPCRVTKVLPSGIQVGWPANPAPPRPPPRPPAWRDSSVMGFFWAKAERERRRMRLSFVIVSDCSSGGGGLQTTQRYDYVTSMGLTAVGQCLTATGVSDAALAGGGRVAAGRAG